MASTLRLSYIPGLTISVVARDVGSATTLETIAMSEVVGEDGEYEGSTSIQNVLCTASVLASGTKVADDLVWIGPDAGDYRVGDVGVASMSSMIDMVHFIGAELFGEISNAQTANENLVMVINGDTFTVTHSGLDADGNRGSQAALVKS